MASTYNPYTDAKVAWNKSTTESVETNNSKSAEVNRENAGLFDKYKQSYDDLTKTNPFETDTAKAILAKYDLAGLRGRDNAVASGSATNGGNIDSYAAANAMRQQASLVNQGQMAVLEAHQQKIDNVRGLLSDMGVNIDRVFNQDETAKNNDVARKSQIASVTGSVPTEWTYDNNIYLNKDGTVKDEFMTDEFDNTGGFTAIINDAKAKLATTTDSTERANLQATINAATQAKALKTFSSPKYSKYAHEVSGVASTPTESARQFNENLGMQNKALDAEISETAKNNAVARNEVISNLSGYLPDEWVSSNNPYINENGTIKDEYKDVDFSKVMAEAKANNNAALYKYAAEARFYKIMGDYGTNGQYDDGNYIVPEQQPTMAKQQYDDQMELQNNKSSGYTVRVGSSSGSSGSKSKTKPTLTAAQARQAIKDGIITDATIDAYNYYFGGNYTVNNPPSIDGTSPVDGSSVSGSGAEDDGWTTFKDYFTDKKVSNFLDEQLKPYYDNGREINEEVLENLIVGSDVKNSNSTTYDIDVEDAKAICNALGLDDSWVDKYKNRWGLNSGKGMKSAE